MTTKTRTALTADDIEDGYSDERWEGFGYLHERASCGRIAWMQVVDAALIDQANAAGWTAEDLFAFTNSKLGRWFADETLHSYSASEGIGRLRFLADRAAAKYVK